MRERLDWQVLARSTAMSLLAGLIVFVAYFPSDSIAVERGDAIWTVVIALIIGTITWSLPINGRDSRWCQAIDFLAIMLGIWIAAVAFLTCPPGNLRLATNEAWWWIAAAVLFTSMRRLLSDVYSQRAALVLLSGIATAQGVIGMYQQEASLPKILAEYRAAPERVLKQAQIDAPEGSAMRMVFENRLLDGGPTGTFALANSLAGILVVGYLILGVGCLTTFREGSRVLAWLSLFAAGLICIPLFFTNSRSGILAAIGGMVIAATIFLANQFLSGKAKRTAITIAFVSLGLEIVTLMGLSIRGTSTVVAAVPMSLLFRFQYWQATWQLVVDRPWFGCGPGSFQAVYPSYRVREAAESIAEPHNLFFETLGAGGFVAGAIFVAFAVAVVVQVWMHGGGLRNRTMMTEDEESTMRIGRWWWLGAIAALVLVWILGLATGQAPDWEAQQYAVPVGVSVVLGGLRATRSWGSGNPSSSERIFTIAAPALVGLGLHLVVSSGFTIPGLAVWLWILLALVVPTGSGTMISVRRSEKVSEPHNDKNRAKPWWPGLVIGLVLLVGIRFVSIGPIENSAALIRRADDLLRKSPTNAARLYAQAAQADPWSIEPTLRLAETLRGQIIESPNDPMLREQWQSVASQTIALSGGDPAILKLIASQGLHIYQRTGANVDLTRARDLFERVRQCAPTDAAVIAQCAEIGEALGDLESSKLLAREAFELSELGPNLERRLWLQPILIAAPSPLAARNGPVLSDAATLLQNQLVSDNVLPKN